MPSRLPLRLHWTSTQAWRWLELGLLVGMAAVLIRLFVPALLQEASRRRVVRAHSDVERLAGALGRLQADTQSKSVDCFDDARVLSSSVPPAVCGDGLIRCAARDPNDDRPCWGGPYLARVPLMDPWSRPYRTEWNQARGAIAVRSTGPDGAANDPETPGSLCGGDDICVVQ